MSKKIDDVEKVWREFWMPLLANEKGRVTTKAIKKELFDYAWIMDEVAKVYCHITNGKLSKVNYKAETIISEYEEIFNRQVEEAVEERLKEIQEESGE